MSFIWRRRSSILSSSGTGSGAFSSSDDVDPARGGVSSVEPEKVPEPAVDDDNIDDLRRQMKDMQDRLERMSKEPKKEE